MRKSLYLVTALVLVSVLLAACGGGGDSGGEVIAAGQPSEICSSPQSYTGEYLKSYLKANHSK